MAILLIRVPRRREKRPRRPARRTSILSERQARQREQVRFRSTGEARPDRVCRKLLLQDHSPGQPVNQRVIKLNRQREPGNQSGGVIPAVNVRKLMGQHGPAIGGVP